MVKATAPASRQRTGARWPAGLACGPAFFGPLAVCVVLGSVVPLPIEVSVLVLLVATVGLLATAPAGLIAVGASLLSLNAFGENGLGVLALHPRVDAPVAVTLLCAWAVAWAAGGSPGRQPRRPTTELQREDCPVVDVAFVVLTLALFGLLALVLRGVERL